MRPGGRPKAYSNGARWVSTGGGRKRKAKAKTKAEPKQEINPDILYDSDGDGKADLVGWILHAPAPECPTWLARSLVLGFIAYICIKYG